MTLTEQWKKGELERGWYYIECVDLPERWIDIDYYRNDCYEDEGFCKGFFDHNDWRGIDKILAPVPSYEEWQRIFHYASKYEYEYTSCAMDYENLKQENQQLKEMLKECREEFICINNGGAYWSGDFNEILEKLDNAIGEKKC
jgi:hypothetical protein